MSLAKRQKYFFLYHEAWIAHKTTRRAVTSFQFNTTVNQTDISAITYCSNDSPINDSEPWLHWRHREQQLTTIFPLLITFAYISPLAITPQNDYSYKQAFQLCRLLRSQARLLVKSSTITLQITYSDQNSVQLWYSLWSQTSLLVSIPTN